MICPFLGLFQICVHCHLIKKLIKSVACLQTPVSLGYLLLYGCSQLYPSMNMASLPYAEIFETEIGVLRIFRNKSAVFNFSHGMAPLVSHENGEKKFFV